MVTLVTKHKSSNNSSFCWPNNLYHLTYTLFSFSINFMIVWNQYGYQDCASSLMAHIVKFYDYSMLVVFLIVALVSFAIYSILKCPYRCRYIIEAETLEVIWRILPAGFLVFIAVPSLRLLYLTDEVVYPFLRVKAIGHQWYWSYDYTFIAERAIIKEFVSIRIWLFYDSYISPFEDLFFGDPRLLEVGDRLVLPVKEEIRIQVTAADVLHCWSVPSLGVKIDAVPGRLNTIPLFILSPGIYFGLCSEICGVNHSFIPIVVEVISVTRFYKWAFFYLFYIR